MTPAQLNSLAKMHIRSNDPDASKKSDKPQGLGAFVTGPKG